MFEFRNIPHSLRSKVAKEKLLKVIEENEVVYMAIFGSFVKKQQRKKSDIDILIKFKDNSKKTLFDIADLQYSLRKIFGRKVDIVEIDAINRHIREEVLKSKKVIYEAG